MKLGRGRFLLLTQEQQLSNNNMESKASFVVRFGVIGTNFITDKFIEAALLDKRFVLSAVYSRTEERAIEYGRKFGCSNFFTDLQEMAASSLVDAVYIASPTSFHAAHCKIFINEGKHVLCEKPVCSNAAELDEVLAAARAKGTAFMEAHRGLLSPNLTLLRDSLPHINPVRVVAFTFCQQSSRYPAFLRGERPNAFLPQFSNGALMDLGCYAVAACVFLFGEPNSVHYVPVMLETGVDGSGTLLLGYDGLTASVVISKTTSGFSLNEVQGEKGTLLLDHLGEVNSVFLQGKNAPRVQLSPSVEPAVPNNMVHEVAAFLELVQTGKVEDERVSWALSRSVIAVLDKARRAGGIAFPADDTC
jgi:predicted dehydrogenase